jgi:indoleamine 2,3-dioxygenase
VPLWDVARALDVPPTLTHSIVGLANFRRLPGPGVPIAQLVPLLGGMDEMWFFAVAIAIERAGARALVAMAEALAIDGDDSLTPADADARMGALYTAVAEALRDMTSRLNETSRRCHPRIFYERVRIFLNGWNHAALPEGVEFRGVAGNPRVRHNGASAAQSALLPAIDAFLGVSHAGNDFLARMRSYMPREHRAFIDLLERRCPAMIATVTTDSDESRIGEGVTTAARSAHNDAVAALHEFRSAHIVIVTRFIVMQSKRGTEEKGTGGSDLIPFLKGVRDDDRR